jgi:hypothetical protein
MRLVISISVKVYNNFVLCLNLYTAEVEYYYHFGPSEVSNKYGYFREIQNTRSLILKKN